MVNQGVEDFVKSPITKVVGLTLFAFSFFYLGQHWSDGNQQLVFFNNQQQSDKSLTPSIAISPNVNKTISSEPPPSHPQNHPFMAEDFEVGDFDPDLVDKFRNLNMSIVKPDDVSAAVVEIGKYSLCSEDMRLKKLDSTVRGEKFERHCPGKDSGLNCLIPPPKGYKTPIPWPQSRDEVWFSNVPHSRLVDDKGGQNWIERGNDKFKFPGGGTQFIHGADKYLDQIEQMVPEIAFGNHTRVVLGVGCGVASFGAFCFPEIVVCLRWWQLFATRRLLYPSQAFELIHCSRCRINWTRDDGIYLLEVNRMLRGGGYFVWAAQPVYKHEIPLQKQWKEMEDLTTRLCWELVKKEGYVAIWRKPSNNSCYAGAYVDMKACISRLPDNAYGANVTTWPSRLNNIPDRIQSIQLDSQISRGELYKAENGYWKNIVTSYVHVYHWEKKPFRNVMDMRAGFGGYAAALINMEMDYWIMNVVPVSGPNTLPVIYDRGLIGVMHD
ncbi:hypothetical protein MKW92_026479, partial [Papaver armeniacum]